MDQRIAHMEERLLFEVQSLLRKRTRNESYNSNRKGNFPTRVQI